MATTTWNLDPAHSEVHFKVRHLVIATVSGKFNKFSSTVTTEGDDFSTANIEFSVETASIDTGMEARDNHLRSNDFFNSEAFPNLTFKSTGVRSTSDGEYQLDGLLTIRDVTQPATLKVELGGIAKDPYGNTKAAFQVEGKVKRNEFGLTWNALTEAGGAVVSDEVKFTANIQYAKAQA